MSKQQQVVQYYWAANPHLNNQNRLIRTEEHITRTESLNSQRLSSFEHLLAPKQNTRGQPVGRVYEQREVEELISIGAFCAAWVLLLCGFPVLAECRLREEKSHTSSFLASERQTAAFTGSELWWFTFPPWRTSSKLKLLPYLDATTGNWSAPLLGFSMLGGCEKILLQARETPLPAALTVKILLLTGTLTTALVLENCCKSRCNNDGGPERSDKNEFPGSAWFELWGHIFDDLGTMDSRIIVWAAGLDSCDTCG